MNTTTLFPIRDDKGKIRDVSLHELQDATYYSVYRTESEVRRMLETRRSTLVEDIMDGVVAFPQTVAIVRDGDFEPVIYASFDNDKTFRLIYYRG